jgi:hypothetical protein
MRWKEVDRKKICLSNCIKVYDRGQRSGKMMKKWETLERKVSSMKVFGEREKADVTEA